MGNRPKRYRLMRGPCRVRELARAAERDFDGSCVIYFAQAGDFGPIKIGYTSERALSRRLCDLQCGCPWPITIRRLIPGSRALESELHRVFNPWQLTGEWFQPVTEVATLAHAVCFGAANLEPNV
jgi:hypothetical protein